MLKGIYAEALVYLKMGLDWEVVRNGLGMSKVQMGYVKRTLHDAYDFIEQNEKYKAKFDKRLVNLVQENMSEFEMHKDEILDEAKKHNIAPYEVLLSRKGIKIIDVFACETTKTSKILKDENTGNEKDD